jgi:hypothetical protein
MSAEEIKNQNEELTPETAGVVGAENIDEGLSAVATGEAEAETEGAEAEKSGKEKTVMVKGKKKKKKEPFLRGGRGQVHIKSTYNNTIISVTDLNGALLAWASAGK